MAKMSITFPGFADLAEQLDRMEGNLLKTATEEMLENTFDIVDQNLATAAAPYARKGGGKKGYATGKMYRARKSDGRVKKESTYVYSVGVGFESGGLGGGDRAGFMHSIFVMYGTPRMKKDTKVYNAIRGKATRDKIMEMNEEIMRKYLSLGGNK